MNIRYLRAQSAWIAICALCVIAGMSIYTGAKAHQQVTELGLQVQSLESRLAARHAEPSHSLQLAARHTVTLKDLTSTLPPGVELTDVDMNGGEASFGGRADSFTQINTTIERLHLLTGANVHYVVHKVSDGRYAFDLSTGHSTPSPLSEVGPELGPTNLDYQQH